MKLLPIIFIVTIFLNFSCAINKSLREQYPDKLLSDDYGILNEKDLIDENDELPIGPIGKDSNPAPRWICAKNQNLKFKCVGSNIKTEELNDFSADFYMTIVDGKKEYDFFYRGQISNERCDERIELWKKLMDGENYFCAAGALMNADRENEDIISAAFYRFKTKKGCDAWIEGDC